MNSINEHLEKARHNSAFIDRVDIDTFVDWAIVVLFYCALHLTSAVVHAKGDDHGTSHPKRQIAIERHFSNVNAQRYEQLYSRSRLVRYEQIAETPADYNLLFKENFLPLLEEAKNTLPQIQ